MRTSEDGVTGRKKTHWPKLRKNIIWTPPRFPSLPQFGQFILSSKLLEYADNAKQLPTYSVFPAEALVEQMHAIYVKAWNFEGREGIRSTCSNVPYHHGDKGLKLFFSGVTKLLAPGGFFGGEFVEELSTQDHEKHMDG